MDVVLWFLKIEMSECVVLQNAYIEMTYLAIDRMNKQKGGNGGTVLNVCSAAGQLVKPNLASSAPESLLILSSRCCRRPHTSVSWN